MKKLAYKDKNASKLYMDNPDYLQTEVQWTEKQIFRDRKENAHLYLEDRIGCF